MPQKRSRKQRWIIDCNIPQNYDFTDVNSIQDTCCLSLLNDGKKFLCNRQSQLLTGLSRNGHTMNTVIVSQILLALHHPNIVACSLSWVERGKLHIVMEYCSEGATSSCL